MKIEISDVQVQSDIEIVLVKEKKLGSQKKLLEQIGFKGEDETCILLPESKKIYVGCESTDEDNVRIAAATAIRKFNETNYTSATISINKDLQGVLEGVLLGSYTFDKYKSKKDDRKEKTLTLIVKNLDEKTMKAFNESTIVCEGVNLVRDFVNTTPDDFYPKIMAKEARKIAQENNLKCTVLDDEYFTENGMGAIKAVGRASKHKSKLIHLTYKPKDAKKKVVLVGKGLTYDSGGLSLKPADFMVTMKSDKSGGCAVLGLMDVISKLQLPIEVHGIVGAVENMIGGNAYKPDDVLTAKNGKTIEIRNTDAEGRLVLADCLCYAQDEIKDFDHIIDYATLTGASVVGVGAYTTSIMGNNMKLTQKMVDSALASGELATTLPFNRYLKKTISSSIADVCNISNTRYGGAITAGMFLANFIDEKNKDKWVHCDIAGPAFVEAQWGYNPHGGSGAGVRMTVEFLKGLLK
jgi:leucyl aminopeptidase